MALDFEGLLGNPVFTGGLGLLAAGLDDRPVSEGILQGLKFAGVGSDFASAAQQREAQRLQNEAAREELRLQARQQRARDQILASQSPGVGAGVLSPQALDIQQNGLDINNPGTLGLLAEANPELVFGSDGLLAQQLQPQEASVSIGGQRIPFDKLPNDTQQAVVQEALENGGPMDFTDPRQARALSERIDSVRGKERAMEVIAQQQAAMEAQRMRAEAKISQFEAENLQLKRDSILKESLNNALDVSRTLRNLIGTAAEPGGFEWTRDAISMIGKAGDLTPQFVQDAFGVNATEAQRLSGLMETLMRESKGNLVLNLKKLSELGINPTDRKTSELADLSPSLENQPEDNLRNTLKILRGVKSSVEATPGDLFGDDDVEREVQAEIDIIERMLDVKGTSGTVNPPSPTRTPILQLPGGASLGNFRSE